MLRYPMGTVSWAFVLISLVILGNSLSSCSWTVTWELNPNCTEECDTFNLVHVAARNETSSVHILFSASQRICPSVLLLHSDVPTADPLINWKKMLNPVEPVDAISLEGVTQSYAVLFSKLIEYNDTHDFADMSKVPANEDFYKVHLLNEWSWKLTTPLDTEPHTIDGNHIFEVNFEGNNTDTVCANDGHVKLKFAISAMEQRNPRMPRLKFVQGLSTQFEFAMASLHTNFIRGRFGLQLLFVSNESVIPGEDFRLESLFSINDEVTPGIFEMVNIKLGERDNSTTSTLQSHSNTPQSSWPTGFIQARPVCYTSERYREVKASRDAKLSKQRTVLNTSDQELLLPRTLPYLFYAQRIKPTDDPREVVGIRLQNISFGTPGDGYYVHSSFIVWTISFGFGEPPIDTLSPLLIGLITLSAVVVLGSLLFGTMLILIFQRRYRFGEFQRLTETDTTSAVST